MPNRKRILKAFVDSQFDALFKIFTNKVQLLQVEGPSFNQHIENLKRVSQSKAQLETKKAESRNALDELTLKKSQMGNKEFEERLLVLRNMRDDLDQKTEALVKQEAGYLEDLKKDLDKAATHLPGVYRENYFHILLRNLESVQVLSPGTLETLAGAVHDHVVPGLKFYLRSFLALTSNMYRSFMDPDLLPLKAFPEPDSRLPALATFRPKLDAEHFVPFTLPVDEVNRLCGATVAVVSVPFSYRDHSVLTWGCVAHEVGGHDVLHSYPGLLPELRRGIRELFYRGPDPHNGKLNSKNQSLGLVWQHWAEETASDVCAVLNLGPTYGIALPIYLAALSQALREWNSRGQRDPYAALALSSRRFGSEVDAHPPAILALYAVIGAIEALSSLSEDSKTMYSDAIGGCLKHCLLQNKEVFKAGKGYKDGHYVRQYETDRVRICGWLRLRPGNWIEIEPNDQHATFELKAMEQHARRVGYYIVSAQWKALNGYSLQDLETWDEGDEEAAWKIKEMITQRISPEEQDRLDQLKNMGDDAQLFAGSVLALADQPSNDVYDIVNMNLARALERSFDSDPIWGNPVWHPIAASWSKKDFGGPPCN